MQQRMQAKSTLEIGHERKGNEARTRLEILDLPGTREVFALVVLFLQNFLLEIALMARNVDLSMISDATLRTGNGMIYRRLMANARFLL